MLINLEVGLVSDNCCLILADRLVVVFLLLVEKTDFDQVSVFLFRVKVFVRMEFWK